MKILGLMSGTSLDGLDLVMLEINNIKKWKILKATTIQYEKNFQNLIKNIRQKTAFDLAFHHFQYSRHVAKLILKFIKSSGYRPEYISFPGQTIFHQPQKGFTYQLGSGSVLAAMTGVPVVSDFRSADVALGGQGAPLVPCVEFELWKGVDVFLNLGGIANYSFIDKKNQIKGEDICPCNMALNELAALYGMEFDKDGKLAANGKTDLNLLKQLVEKFMHNNKSLGYEDYEMKWKGLIFPINKKNKVNTISTVTEAIAHCIIHKLLKINPKVVMVTGGGAWNKELMKRITTKLPTVRWNIPNRNIVKYKEAIVFAFLAYKRIKKENNVLSSVTGALRNHISGCIHL